MKKILASALVVAAATTALIGGTRAFFSDTETTDDNSFVAGTLDLTVDFHDEYYGADRYDDDGLLIDGPLVTSWPATDLGSSEVFWDLDDVKPGDHGNGWISLHLTDNPAWTRVLWSDVHNDENLCTEPEGISGVDDTCGVNGGGELAENLYFRFWIDTNQDGIEDSGETLLTAGTADNITDGLSWDITDEPLPAGVTNIGYSWVVPAETGNVIQSDSFRTDIMFEIEQSRHNAVPSWTP